MGTVRALFGLALLAMIASSCVIGGDEPWDDNPNDTDTELAGDTDTDSDTDTGPDGDTDTDTDTDGDGDSDTDDDLGDGGPPYGDGGVDAGADAG